MDNNAEFERTKENIIQNFVDHDKHIYIWGAGVLGKELGRIVRRYKILAAFIDIDLKKQEYGCNGVEVISFEHYIQGKKTGLIVIAATEEHTQAIRKQLINQGKKENRDFLTAENFLKQVLPVIAFYEYDELFVSLSQISVTERCTLKCRKCAHGCYNVDKNSKDFDIENVMNSADSFFSNIDFAGEFVLIGGEPLLYGELKEAVRYIGSKYRSQIGIFSITTNGTIMPEEDLLEECNKYQITFRISNYSGTIPRLENRYQSLCEKLDAAKVHYILGDPEATWIDYGFGEYCRAEGENLTSVFKACNTLCREIRNNRFYYCVMARSISENLEMFIGEDDYLDLETIDGKDREIILKFQLGYLEKGYLDMCRFCRGSEAKKYVIPAAEQVKI